jgi:hypothetical protein
MTKEEFKSAIEDNKVITKHVTAADIANITPYAHINLEIDSETLDYFYSINLEELLDSDVPNDILDEIKNQGWALDKSKKNIIIYLTI